MAILTKTRLTAITESRLGTVNFSRVIYEAKLENKAYSTTSIFLSHSHDDLANGDLDKVIVALRSAGVRVYIDSKDGSMPPFPNAETAHNIKQAIRDNKKFILLASNRAINSKWCKWELGYGDAHKYLEHIALFPLSETVNSWEGNEYLRIYPRIEENDNQTGEFKVIYPNGRQVTLRDWLATQ